MSDTLNSDALDSIAIIGMTGRFPGAGNIDEFWRNLRDGVESITFFTDQELEAAGVDPVQLKDPHYVKARGVLDGIEYFDAKFFSIPPRQAEITDPQQRIFLECAWEALENAGYDPERYQGQIGVYAGVGRNSYIYTNLLANPEIVEKLGGFQAIVGNDKDFLATQVSYKLNLQGPSMSIQTACSTSLVAISLACQSLLTYQADMALAGGVCINMTQKAGYFYQEGGIASPDGHCRAFDARAQGTVGGSGVGIVVLKRLVDALEDKDYIHAIIRGSAINNDGSLKVGYTAPGVEGQSKVIAMAQALAGVDPETITYIEAHGTGTPLGDPVEVEALTRAFRASTKKKGFCAIGSVKTNVGHLDAASGVTGLIKTTLALKNQMLPPSLHFESNPGLDLANSPFYVNTTLSEWKSAFPRRAGVSSFGVGGTNAHVILEEAPTRELAPTTKPWQLFVLSARSASALDAASSQLALYLRQHPELNGADVAYTLQVGRSTFPYRRTLVCRDLLDAVTTLEGQEPQRLRSSFQASQNRPIVFMFPGQGTQYVNMALELYQTEPAFRRQVDLCSQLLKSYLGQDLRDVLYPREEEAKAAQHSLNETSLTQPALFVIEYSLATLWMQWGIKPQVMIGHSIGEYVAACLAGVFSLEDGLKLVAARGRLMQQQPAGAMLNIALPLTELQRYLDGQISLAAINGPSSCVLSGPLPAIEAIEEQLAMRRVQCRRLQTAHAFHSAMMEPILGQFRDQFIGVALKSPVLPYISNVSGTWITAAQATDPAYWVQHLRQTVQFARGLENVFKKPECILLEVGPGHTLSSFAQRHPGKPNEQPVFTSLGRGQERGMDSRDIFTALGHLWLAGAAVDWSNVYADEHRQRIPLPTYPFERERYWVEPGSQYKNTARPRSALYKKPEIAQWFYLPSWKRSMLPVQHHMQLKSRWYVFVDSYGIGPQLVQRLQQEGHDVVVVQQGTQFTQSGYNIYSINPAEPEDYVRLLSELQSLDRLPTSIAHVWSLTRDNGDSDSDIEQFTAVQQHGFYSLLFLAQAFSKLHIQTWVDLNIVSNNIQEVGAEDRLSPEKVTLLGPCKVIAQEYPHIVCRSIDVTLPGVGMWQEERLINQLLAELEADAADATVAYRGEHRWVQTFEPFYRGENEPLHLRKGGVYLITGGLGNIGLTLARYLIQTVQAKIVLLGRSALPEKALWQQWLVEHPETDRMSRKIRAVQSLEEKGGEVLLFSADVANQSQMEVVIERITKNFGQLHGVFHLAGAPTNEIFSTIQETDQIRAAQQFRPKVYGLYVLERVLQGKALDFCLLQSSLSAVLGGLGFASYAAANIFMDAFAHRHNQMDQVPWISVNWDGWSFSAEVLEPSSGVGASIAGLAIYPHEGVEVFQRLFSGDYISQLVISTGDLTARMSQWIQRHRHGISENEEEDNVLHPRPTTLFTTYAPPENDLENSVVSIWQGMLGIDQIGIHDSFFDLGGDSLMATQLISKLRATFSVDVPLRSLFEGSTIAELARVVETTRSAEQQNREKVTQIIQSVQQLSDDEVRALLQAKRSRK